MILGSNFHYSWINFVTLGSNLVSLVVYASRDLKIASRLLQDGLLEPIWAQLRPKMAPSWLKLGPCWAQVGSKLAQVAPKIGSMSIQEASWRVLDGSREAPGGPRSQEAIQEAPEVPQ